MGCVFLAYQESYRGLNAIADLVSACRCAVSELPKVSQHARPRKNTNHHVLRMQYSSCCYYEILVMASSKRQRERSQLTTRVSTARYRVAHRHQREKVTQDSVDAPLCVPFSRVGWIDGHRLIVGRCPQLVVWMRGESPKAESVPLGSNKHTKY